MIFDKIIDVEKILLNDLDILAKLKKLKAGNIILPDSNGGVSEDSNEYAEIVMLGDGIAKDDKRLQVGNIIIAASNGRGNKSFKYKKDKYVIFSMHTVEIVVTPDNFKDTK